MLELKNVLTAHSPIATTIANHSHPPSQSRIQLTYNGLKSRVNVIEGLENFVEENIRVGKEEAGTSAFNEAYDK